MVDNPVALMPVIVIILLHQKAVVEEAMLTIQAMLVGRLPPNQGH